MLDRVSGLIQVNQWHAPHRFGVMNARPLMMARAGGARMMKMKRAETMEMAVEEEAVEDDAVQQFANEVTLGRLPAKPIVHSSLPPRVPR